MIYSERRGSMGLHCRVCRIGVWTDASTARRFMDGRSLKWREFMDMLFTAYASRLAMVGQIN